MFNFLLANPADMPAPMGIDSWLTFWLIVVIAFINATMLVFAGYKFLQVIQLSGYKIRGYFDWISDTKAKYWGMLIMLSFLSSAALLITNVLLEDFFVYKIMTYIGMIFYFIFMSIFIANIYNAPQKTPLKYTKRMTRLIGVLFLIVFVVTFYVLRVSVVHIPYFDYGIVGLTPIILPILVIMAYYITLPFEIMVNRIFLNKAKKKLSELKKLMVIGITGSYGKTTVKNILATLLSEKYSVCSTPYSYNTPLGLSKTVLNDLNSQHEILIAEMGAKQIGDISFLCEMVKPQIGILTGLTNQHLSTFRTFENIKKAKYELVEGLVEGGKMFFNGDCSDCVDLYNKNKGNKFLTALTDSSGDIWVSDISVNAKGSKFKIHFKNGTVIKCNTILLGEHNISNILICAAVASELGLSSEEIKSGIEKLVPTAHRLAVIPSSNSLIVIDDAYNASVAGAAAALKVLSMFDGQKIVITPGLVELGKESFNINFEFGRSLASVCDYVIINGVINYTAISSGLEFAGFNPEKILRAGSLKQAVEVLSKVAKPGDVVLFENDLPDNYT